MHRRAAILQILVACGAVTTSIVAASVTGGAQTLAIMLAVGQTFGLAWLVGLSIARGGNWANATFVTAVVWAPLFLVPCWIYALDPTLLRTTSAPAQPIAIVDVSLFALIGGLLVDRYRHGKPSPPDLVHVVAAPEVSRRALIGLGVFGLACLGLLMAANGGPIAYITSQYNSAQLNRGLFYLIWGVMFLRYAPLTAVATRWAQGRRASRGLIAYLVIGCGIVLVMGTRELIAVALVQVLLVAALIRRRPRLSTVAVPALLIGLLVVFGLGAVKFYESYEALHPHRGIGFVSFVENVLPAKTENDYVNNYVDGVSLIGLGRRLVPAQAHYEYGLEILQLLLKPIPSGLRPQIAEQPVLKAAFNPPGFTYAIPLQLSAYLEFGIGGVVVVFFGVGALLGAVDRRLAARRQSLPALLALATLAVQIPVLLRGGVPAGVAYLLIDVVGVWIAATLLQGRLRVQLLRGWTWLSVRRRGHEALISEDQ